ncbi:bifunctional N-acetylglucosamine-1-phosphate uridyltransferase/glucosamine-1-phosphate acetyltransferase [Lysinibacillus sphaericus]|uniref:bifunctional UDP-N-acetylglucosamine diphosphorylase/glucosamine-1-phosphate N-acetyltransferase GlmU n=1 Tax=Lysinibacillus TaxID=400634 RepID=UPI0009A626AD|nr:MULTISPECIES: bifunctional UDP-N-acetylglucosamine diphosphorylase/glucosamine-1-phosphate N-acetyltransferase GlmU [Lysinibacillus]MBG9453941.1 bifunctional N-acetylglucosamine-1-phosphate uridyltransferase/glucosamine-1-phosphate acetyltransferase [Lysinibacillus sphaericus]MBG9477322.1 bifunctional N-acetylglucosamine-1-phosphate uridyltransferase/glucosamine-1-phosphate acetyltransferase [Lysinibacillus sphaericus]MBG9592965.1 bifunctional N-acetylglucosamine-1-phosphate uridyltransferase
MSNIFAVILAAGQGTRMKSKLYKVLHPVCGKPMVQHVVDHIQTLDVKRIVTVVGHGAEMVKQQLGDKSEYVLQAEQLGTAHAVQQAEAILSSEEGTTLVVCGDTPLIRPETMQALFEHHQAKKAKATILTAIAENPTGYGRILRGDNGQVEQIVEQKDASAEQQLVKEINTGTYCFDNKALFETLKLVKNDNAQGEYYLPDVIEILQKQGEVVEAYVTGDFEETLGVNDRVALSQAEALMRTRINEKHMRNGVTIINPEATYISAEAMIGRDTVIQPGSMIEGTTVIGEDCIIGPNTQIIDSRIGDRTTVHSSVVRESAVAEDTAIGPFANIRPLSDIGSHVKIGNFVEVKKSKLGNDTKVSHLSYIGDAEIGSNVNVGCGSITVNYDGKNKFQTIIEDDVFVGCNTNLVAPVKVGKGSFIAAGSTITKEVPEDALAIARARQENKPNYVSKLNSK